jgi:hypothetical protein
MTQQAESTAPVQAPVATNGFSGASPAFTSEHIQELLARLCEPFGAEQVEWRVTTTARGKRGLRGQVAAYAGQRAYTDRLNALFSPIGWTRDYAVQTVQNFELPQKGTATMITAKVMVICKVTIHGLGTHSGTGEEWATDGNALTRAEAQAFKRACSCFGLGRYFGTSTVSRRPGSIWTTRNDRCWRRAYRTGRGRRPKPGPDRNRTGTALHVAPAARGRLSPTDPQPGMKSRSESTACSVKN